MRRAEEDLMRRLVPLIALVVAVSALALPARAHHDGTDEQPTLRTERTFLKCVDGLKVQNIPALQGSYPTWSPEPPAGSVQDGEGCGQYENLLSNSDPENPFDLVMKGTFTGNLDTINVELHNIYVGTPRATGNFLIAVDLTIDGEQTVATEDPVTINPVPSSTGISEEISFSVTDIGLLTEHGDGTTEREIRLSIAGFNEYQSAWVWDTTEVPAGLTFNPDSLESVKLTALS